MSNARQDPPERIAVSRLGSHAGPVATFLPPAEILYAFLGTHAPPELFAGQIERNYRFEPRRVYVRTARGVFWTHYTRLAALRRELDPIAGSPFLPINRGVLVNTVKIAALDTGGRTPLVLLSASDGAHESLPVSRRDWPALRARLRLPRRWRGTVGGPSAPPPPPLVPPRGPLPPRR